MRMPSRDSATSTGCSTMQDGHQVAHTFSSRGPLISVAVTLRDGSSSVGSWNAGNGWSIRVDGRIEGSEPIARPKKYTSKAKPISGNENSSHLFSDIRLFLPPGSTLRRQHGF